MALPFESDMPVDILPNAEEVLRPQASMSEALSASFELGAKDMTTLSLSRMVDFTNKMSSGNKISPEDLNKKYQGQGMEFTYPMTESAAESLINEKNERVSLEDTIARGPRGTISSVLNFGAALVPHIFDPIDLLAGAGVGKMGKFAWLASKGKLGIIAKEGAEQFVGNLLVEPISMAAASIEDREYGASQAFINSLGGAILGTGLKFGLGATISKVRGEGWGGHLAKLHAAEANLLNGKYVDVKSIELDRLDQITPSRQVEFQRFNINESSAGKRFFAASFDNAENNKTFHSMGDDMGDGLYLTTSKEVANGAAANRYEQSLGNVFEFEGKEQLRLIDLDEPISIELRQEFPDYFGRLKENATMREFLDDIRLVNNEDLNKVASELQAKGYDGYYHDNRVTSGESGREENIIMLFDKENKMTKISQEAGSREAVRPITKERLLDIAQKNQSIKGSPLKAVEEDFSKETKKHFQQLFW